MLITIKLEINCVLDYLLLDKLINIKFNLPERDTCVQTQRLLKKAYQCYC